MRGINISVCLSQLGLHKASGGAVLVCVCFAFISNVLGRRGAGRPTHLFFCKWLVQELLVVLFVRLGRLASVLLLSLHVRMCCFGFVFL